MPVLLLDLDETLLDRTSTFRRWATELVDRRGGTADDVEWLIQEDRGGYRPKDELVALVNERFQPVEQLMGVLT